MSIDAFQLVFNWAGLVIPLIIGGILVLYRPYWAFLFAVFLSIGLSMETQSFTRTEELGAFFTMYDAVLIIFIAAFLFDSEKIVTAPAVIFAMLAVLVIGLLQSVILLGLFYGPLRIFRWAITIPVLFVIAASMVRGEARLKSFLLTLIVAAVAAEVQHLFIVGEANRVVSDVTQMRTVLFIGSASEAWLLAGPYVASGLIPHPWLQVAIGTLFLLANVSHQTRSIALGFLGGLPLFYLWLIKGQPVLAAKKLKGFFCLLMIGAILLAVTGFSEMASSYQGRLFNTFTKQGEGDNISRVRAIHYELRAWLDSNLITGQGLSYQDIYRRKLEGVAFGHLGYIAYLSQLGIIGFLVYGVWFPAAVLRRARRIIKTAGASPVVLHLACLTGACFLMQALIFAMSGSYLQRLPVPGLLAGAVWAISPKDLNNSEDENEILQDTKVIEA